MLNTKGRIIDSMWIMSQEEILSQVVKFKRNKWKSFWKKYYEPIRPWCFNASKWRLIIYARWIVAKETVVPRRLGNETGKLGIRPGDMGKMIITRRSRTQFSCCSIKNLDDLIKGDICLDIWSLTSWTKCFNKCFFCNKLKKMQP